MPVQKSKKPVKPVAQAAAKKPAAKTAAKAVVKAAVSSTKPSAKVEISKKTVISNKATDRPAQAGKASVKSEKTPKKEPSVPSKTSPTAKPVATKVTAKEAALKATPVAAVAEAPAKKKPGRPPKNPAAEGDSPATGAKRGRKPKASLKGDGDEDMSDIEDDLVGEPVVETTEKVKPLRMKISKSKERALMKEFGLDEAVLSEEDMLKRRQRLKILIKLGKTRGYLTHGEISDHLPDTPVQQSRPKKKRKSKLKPRSPPSTASLAAPPTRSACTCAKWAQSSC